MPRPCRCRTIRRFPDHWVFYCDERETEDQIILNLDEYETIRLLDLEGLTQEECADRMGVARTTVTAIYENARRKLARHLVEGETLRISGGAYQLVSEEKVNIEKKGQNNMRIAVTYENGMIGQHFGHTEEFKLYDIENDRIVREQLISSNGQGHGMLAGILKEAQVDLLICGGIGMGARNALAEAGIDLVPGTDGPADKTVSAYLQGTLVYDPEGSCHHHDHEGDHCHHEHEGDHCHHENGCGDHHCHES